MAIYHLFINGKYRFKTNSFSEVFEEIASSDYGVHEDIVIAALICDHEYHLFDFEGNRRIDLVVSTYGK